MDKLVIMIVCCFAGFCVYGQQTADALNDIAMLEMANQVEFELSRKDGVVLVDYSSKVAEDIEFQLLSRSGAVLWSKMLYSFQGKEREKLDFLVPTGTYITRVYYGREEVTSQIQFN